MKTGEILVVNQKETKSVLDMPTVLSNVETALKENAEGLCVNPVKLHLPLRPEIEGYLNSMPAYMKGQHLLGAKLVTVFKHNREYGLPVTMGTVVLHHPETGLPYAVVDGTYVTAIRTGAAAGVAAKYLHKTGAHVGLSIGAGAQGYMGARAMLTAVPAIDELRVAEVNPDTMKVFSDSILEEFPNVKIVPFTDYKEALPGAEIITVATTSPVPLLRGIKVDKGATVLLIAENMDNEDLKAYDRCVMDFPECFCERINQELEANRKATGETYNVLDPATANATLGQVIAGLAKGRENDDQTVVCCFVGMGIEDIMVAKTVFDRAQEKGLGTVLDFTGNA